MQCDHKMVKKGAYLPAYVDGIRSTVKNHAYCCDCGVVKVSGPDRGRGPGFFMSVLSDVARRCRLSEVQVRLISNEIKNDELFTDPFGSYYTFQKVRFIEIIRKYAGSRTAAEVSASF